eukprot:TRINITY_DN10407_c0_g1_i1.p1 TRINITY_DN10407_c0_g1~~TRINITY_DN10407_c0_g1_i1.p1  ORF type:complete len:438 (-),score=71.78 TRINITY_DN10407_c0_g1_i1:56-1369(-)
MSFCCESGGSTGRDGRTGKVIEKIADDTGDEMFMRLLASQQQLVSEMKGLRTELSYDASAAAKAADFSHKPIISVPEPTPINARRPEPKKVTISMTVRRIYDVKTKEQEFTVRLNVRLSWEMPPGEKPPPEEEDDGDWMPEWTPKFRVRGTKSEQREAMYTTEENDGKTYVHGEVNTLVTISEAFELYKFPNDCQDLTIELLSINPCSQCQWVSPAEGELVRLNTAGINLDDFSLLRKVPVTKNLYLERRHRHLHSCMKVKVKVVRQSRYYIINVALIMFLICSFVLCAWAVHPGAIADRWSVDFSLLLTAVAFKLIINDMLPRLSYLTTLDIYVLFGFLFIALATFSHSTLPLYFHGKMDYSALTLPPLSVEGEQEVIDADLISFYAFAGGWLLWNIMFSIYFKISRVMEKSAFAKAAIRESQATDKKDNEILDAD